ncbi:SCO3242 family prenyltransferase, partial [Streptomyces sp. S6]
LRGGGTETGRGTGKGRTGTGRGTSDGAARAASAVGTVPPASGARRGTGGDVASAASASATPLRPAPGTSLRTLAGALLDNRPRDRRTTATALLVGGAALAYLGTYGAAQAKALAAPTGDNVRGAVGAGITALVPLQAALTARAGSPIAAALLGAVHPLARRLARRISPT